MLSEQQKTVLIDLLLNEELRLNRLGEYWSEKFGSGDAGLFWQTEAVPFIDLKTKLEEIHELL